MRSGKCPKCQHEKIKIIKDFLHHSGGGNIPIKNNLFFASDHALKTYYICENCGYIEEYLEGEELIKIKNKV